MAPALVESLFNHLTLPPRLPSSQDAHLDLIERALIERVLDSVCYFARLPDFHPTAFDSLRRSLQTCREINANSRLNRISLLAVFRDLQKEDFILVHVVEQNAALIIRRQPSNNTVLFEAFEASPVSEDVLSSENATLQWDFPGCAVTVPSTVFDDPSFQNELGTFLESATSESIKRFTAQTIKNNASVFESRNTPDPALITQMLMTLLEVNGARSFPSILRKRVRDDVSYGQGGGDSKPWRRCPFWLVLRVALQRHLSLTLGGEIGRVYYKFLLCHILSRFLDESLPHLILESSALLRTKLCRRLVKLELDRKQGEHLSRQALRSEYDYLFGALGPRFQECARNATQYIENKWREHKNQIRRPIYRLPKYPYDQDKVLTLPNSQKYLNQIFSHPLKSNNPCPILPPYQLPQSYQSSSSVKKPGSVFANQYFALAKEEEKIEKDCHSILLSAQLSLTARCLQLAGCIEDYMTKASNLYDDNPEEKSMMLLSIMDLWVEMDSCSCRLFDILANYSPVFPSTILDVLQVARRKDLSRVQKIRGYLQQRHASCQGSHMTIFNDPESGCFAEKFYDHPIYGRNLQEIRRQIDEENGAKRARKEEEWLEKCEEFENLSMEAAEASCVYTVDEFQVRTHNDRQCTKCFLERKKHRFNIKIHENPLPASLPESKAAIFEITCPPAFARYRETTWRILSVLALPEQQSGKPFEPNIRLHEYSELDTHTSLMPTMFCLASERKSWLSTHYRSLRFPIPSVEQIFKENGLNLKYFDERLKIHPSHALRQEVTFAHHCRLVIPSTSPFSALNLTSEGPTSYEIMASQTTCPPGLNVHEFLSFQALFSGRSRRWPQILLELGSSNVNFSTEAVTNLMSLLTMQVGPGHNGDPLGIVHAVLQDDEFCSRLLEQLSQRLDAISSNWREINCMETLITIAFRVYELSNSCSAVAVKFLERVRAITSQWMSALQAEIYIATDAETSRRCSEYAFWAALLCRRTFVMHSRTDDIYTLTSEALRCFIVCSITLQHNLGGDPAGLPRNPRNALIRDFKLTYRLRHILQDSLQNHQNAFISAIRTIWPDAEGQQQRIFSQLAFLPHPNKWWAQIIIQATAHTDQQTVHFHLLEGHLLVMGQPMGMLPSELRSSGVLKELFGNQNLLTYPSSVPGMTYTLPINMNGHQIHMGLRNGTLIVIAAWQETYLEFIPSEIMRSDLPSPLVLDCVHWLDLRKRVIEIRQRPNIWKTKLSNWRLDLKIFGNWRATRETGRKRSNMCTLVDPYSSLFQRVAKFFENFESRQHLTVFQPEHGRLTVELRRLGITFAVNNNNLLESPQLRAQIDLDQDAGTWYGLQSKLVLREIIRTIDPNTKRITASTPGHKRTILVPMGEIRCSRDGHHVKIIVENDADFGTFTINDVLKRLECAPEPRLLYLKAMYHAYTSFVLPDALTGRTGTEEAVHILNSGHCQPWAPINKGPFKGLRHLASLTPKREYYPKNLRVLQTTIWNPNLTTSIQYDGFRPIVEDLLSKSKQLATFSLEKLEQQQLPDLSPAGDLHLITRSFTRRRVYQRDDSFSTILSSAPDPTYNSRDKWHKSASSRNVIESTKLIRTWPSKLSTVRELAIELQKWPVIGGYVGTFAKVLLSDILDSQVSMDWGSLVNMCVASNLEDAYHLMFSFGMLSFRKDANMDILRTLMAFATLPDLKLLRPPTWPTYTHFRQNHVPRVDYLVQLMETSLIPYGGDDRTILGEYLSHKQIKKFQAAESAHKRQQEKDSRILSEYLLQQWPCAEPSIEGFSTPVLIDVAQALQIIRPEWLRLYQNLEHSQYLAEVQSVLDRHRSDGNFEPLDEEVKEQEFYPIRIRYKEVPKLRDLIHKSGENIQGPSQLPRFQHVSALTLQASASQSAGIVNGTAKASYSKEIWELETIIKNIVQSKSNVQKLYGQDLGRSLQALRKCSKVTQVERPITVDIMRLHDEISQAQNTVENVLRQIQRSFEQNEPYYWLVNGGLWPAITPVTLLETLRSTQRSSLVFGKTMKEGILHYALSITRLQKLLRVLDAFKNDNKHRLLEEYQNLGHKNWKPDERPDWLLLEIDSNILIRESQVDVALATINPQSKSNSVLQMNMGQGKTSCIMPMAAAVLADSKNLMRVVVPKALLYQTAQLLNARLGGLLGRELRHIPFSRRTPTNGQTIKEFFNIHQAIRKSSGVMLSLPDHILSFKLSGLQQLCDNEIPDATIMIRVQNWLDKTSRDILDECDNILALRTQLIYPSGSQKTVDGHPHRWEISEALLARVDGHLVNLQQDYPHSIEVIRRAAGGFPVVFFLRKDVEDQLITRLVDDIYFGRTQIIPECSKAERVAIRVFISEPRVPLEVAETIKQMFPDRPAFQQIVHLLRGLLVHRILLMTLKKRWNVQYGLHPSRDPIAVPYHAKGTPSDQAEWGHPDVAILFTCLSFYYDGLQINHIRQTLEHILKSDDPSQMYDRFAQNSNLPGSLREWNSINVDDDAQVKEIWSHARYTVVMIDYFLNNFVFPRHAKQFQIKLQASSWDIPLMKNDLSASNKLSTSLTTGFSGTNDWKGMLPLTIHQRDLPGLAHTNAEVLTYLLQARNRGYVRAQDNYGKHISEEGLLRQISRAGIRVLIDAGAQILEMDNLSLVKTWLEIDTTEAPAAVYFNSANKPFVYYKQGRSEIPLLASTYAEDLGDCLVYLDEAHTRGTDLKIPVDARGALTLGLGQTKDHTVQAAMRLRQLGTTQSITFFAPPEVTQSIVDLQKIRPDKIESYDVVCWLLQQTCSGIEQLQPLYYSQGADFCRRSQAALDSPKFVADSEQREQYLECVRQVEQQTLEQLYGPSSRGKSSASTNFSESVSGFMKELNTRRKGFQDTGNAVHSSALQEVEQEREVAYEVETVREAQKPVHYQPFVFSGLHRDLVSFTTTGHLAADTAASEPAFAALRRTSLGRKHRILASATSGKLYVSTEFTKTVRATGRAHDQFQRPVNWILYSIISDIAMIIIPEEAELLIPTLKQSERRHPVFLITFSAPVTRKMIHFNDLRYYSIPMLPLEWKAPSWLKTELGIYAGRLYFEYHEYTNVLSYLGVKEQTGKIAEEDVGDLDEDLECQDDNGQLEDSVEKADIEQKIFSQKPLAFLQDWLALRRKGQDFSQSPMGFICGGKALLEGHPFFSRIVNNQSGKEVKMRKAGAAVRNDDEDEDEEEGAEWGDEYEDGEGADDVDGFDEESTTGSSSEGS